MNLKTLCERQIKELWNRWDFFTREAKPPILMRFPHDPKKVEDFLSSCQQELIKEIVELCNEFQYKRCQGVSYLTQEIRKAIVE